MKDILSIDLETYSSESIDNGVHKYAESPDFEILLFGYAFNYGPVKVVEMGDGSPAPTELLDALVDPNVLKTAYNAAFERNCIASWLGKPMPPEEWQCTMVLAAQAGYPLKLELCGQAMGFPEDEAKIDGRNLIRYFCQPCKPTLANGGRTRNFAWDDYAKWGRFVGYNQRDVEVEMRIRQKLLNVLPTEEEQKFWCLDQKINDSGVRLDVQLIENAIDINDRYNLDLAARARQLTGLSNVNSQTQVKAWLKEIEGQEFKSLDKRSITDVKSKLITEEAKEFLDIRAELTKTSTAKFDKMQECMCRDEHARGLFQFYGATRTGRFSGRNIQLQNLPQNHLSDLDDTRALVRAGSYEELEERHPQISSTLSELIRTAIIPEPGCQFLVADFSAIEARMIAWVAGEEEDLAEFRGKGKIYEATAARMFNVPRETIVQGNPNYALRAKGKVATLACGYGGGPQALIAMGALKSGIPEEELPSLVQQWRDAHPRITLWWKSLEKAARKAIRTRASALDSVGNIRFDYENNNLYMVLPSGRRLSYINARIGVNRFGSESIIYDGSNQVTRKWEPIETYSGKLAENCIQAAARDCLRDTMLRLDAAGFDIRMHVHDEVIINEPIGGRSVDDVIALMRIPPDWAPDLPLNAAGFEASYYMKD